MNATSYRIRNANSWDADATALVKVVNRFTHNKVEYAVFYRKNRNHTDFDVIKYNELIPVPIRKADTWRNRSTLETRYIAGVLDNFVIIKVLADSSDSSAALLTHDTFLEWYEPNF